MSMTQVSPGNVDGSIPKAMKGWLWVMMTSIVTVFFQSFGRSVAVANDVLGLEFARVVRARAMTPTSSCPSANAERQSASPESGAESAGTAAVAVCALAPLEGQQD
jgi:hypothetical protein